jgi:hypothetical protein
MEDLNPETAFNIVNRYLGWGDPGEGGIWFVGIEEADPWGEPDKEYPNDGQMSKLDRARNQIKSFKDRTRCNWYSCDTADALYKPTRTRVFPNIAKIVCNFSTIEKDRKNYRDNHLFREGCRVFQANLFPLGKPNTAKWPDYYKDLFGYDKGDRELYEEKVKETRFKEIYRRWSESKPQVTICLGRSYEDKFGELFNLQEGFKELHPFILCNESQKNFYNSAFLKSALE